MDISCSRAVKILVLVYLLDLSKFHVDATSRTTLPITQYYIDIIVTNRSGKRAIVYSALKISGNSRLSTWTRSISNGTWFTFKKTMNYPANYSIWASGKDSEELLRVNQKIVLQIEASKTKDGVIQSSIFIEQPTTLQLKTTAVPTLATTAYSTTQRRTLAETMPTVKKDTSTSVTSFTTKEKSNEESRATPTIQNKDTPNVTAQNAHKHDEHEHNLKFYISVSLGSLFATLLFTIMIILVRRSIRKKNEGKKRAKYWAKINRACQSQYLSNEEVSTNNPMYEGSRSRTTSNVLYGVPEQQEDIRSKISSKNAYVLNPPTQQSPQVNIVISNACALYQNADDLYSEPGKSPEDVGNYERIRSFIHYENSEVRQNTGSYAEPCVLFNGMFISENTGYVSAVSSNTNNN